MGTGGGGGDRRGSVLPAGSLLDFLKSEEGNKQPLPKLIDFSAQPAPGCAQHPKAAQTLSGAGKAPPLGPRVSAQRAHSPRGLQHSSAFWKPLGEGLELLTFAQCCLQDTPRRAGVGSPGSSSVKAMALCASLLL
ncbi:Tyrosine-protein kinase HCK-like protein [Aix galericulata]|nr:Tyrosine-protein kinase HCK-like protein [Aix galericulata]